MKMIILITAIMAVLLTACTKNSVQPFQQTFERLIPLSNSDTVTVAFRPEADNGTHNWRLHVTLSKALPRSFYANLKWTSGNVAYETTIIYPAGESNFMAYTPYPFVVASVQYSEITVDCPGYIFLYKVLP